MFKLSVLWIIYFINIFTFSSFVDFDIRLSSFDLFVQMIILLTISELNKKYQPKFYWGLAIVIGFAYMVFTAGLANIVSFELAMALGLIAYYYINYYIKLYNEIHKK